MSVFVVTGGAGFIGSHLCDLLVARGHQVIAVDTLVTGAERNLAHHLQATKQAVRLLRVDVNHYLHIPGPIDAVIHLAGLPSPVDYVESPLETLKSSSLGTYHALGLARAKGAKFLLASTSEIYGDPEVHPQREDYTGNASPVGPRAVYYEGKRFAETLTMAYCRCFGVDTRIARIFNTYGPRMRADDGRVVPAFVCAALRGEPLTIFGDGSRTRSFCYVSDLVEGLCRLLEADYHDPINLGMPCETTLRELAELVLRLTGAKSEIRFLEEREDDPRVRRPDITRAQSLLKWEPTTPLEEGLRATIEYFCMSIEPGGPGT